MITSRILIFLVSITIALTGFKSDVHIQWFDFNAGLEKATKEKKILLIDLYTDWCGWCKRMDRDTYEKSNVVKSVGSRFVAVKLNPEKEGSYTYEGKTYNGERLKARITQGKFEGYPTTIFINAKKEIYVATGYYNQEKFLTLLSEQK